MSAEIAVWWCAREGRKTGPLSAEELKRMVRAGQLSKHHRVWREGHERWLEAGAVAGLFDGEGLGGPEPAFWVNFLEFAGTARRGEAPGDSRSWGRPIRIGALSSPSRDAALRPLPDFQPSGPDTEPAGLPWVDVPPVPMRHVRLGGAAHWGLLLLGVVASALVWMVAA